MTWVVERLRIQGVKGVLDRAGDFTLASKGSPRSLAVYAPNACGKSGYADAVEYLFSEDGCVEHLGKGGPDSECGGKHAIPHVLAEEKGIEPMVSITMVDPDSGERLEVSRPVKTGRDDPIPRELAEVVRRAPAHRILRQHDLRRFVVDMTPSEKYGELSRWLGLARLEKVLKHLVTASNALESTDLDREIDERVPDLALHTGGAVCVYDEAAVLAWCAGEVERHLGGAVCVGSVKEIDTAVKHLKERRDQIILSSAAAGSYQAKLSLKEEIEALASSDGLLDRCETAATAAESAERETKRVRGAAENSVFQEVWIAARDVMESQDTDECPVCSTPWPRTAVGSQREALVRLRRSLGRLADLTASQEKQLEALRQLRGVLGELQTCLGDVSEHAKLLSLTEADHTASALGEATRKMVDGDLPPSQLRSECGTLLPGCRQLVADVIKPALEQLVISGVPQEASAIEDTVAHLEALSEALLRLRSLHREREEYREVERAYSKVAAAIREETALLVNDIMTALRDEVACVFKTVHPAGSVPNIYVVPDTDSRALKLRVDFHSSGRTVPPAGYLAESQINTLGLSLFISSVRLFNRRFPFVLLDDIVSSYDAEHRARIVDVIAERLNGFQVFLTTHDWRFYSMLRSRLGDKGWQFERITGSVSYTHLTLPTTPYV